MSSGRALRALTIFEGRISELAEAHFPFRVPHAARGGEGNGIVWGYGRGADTRTIRRGGESVALRAAR